MKYLPLAQRLASGWLPSLPAGQLSLQLGDSGSDLLLQLWGHTLRWPCLHLPRHIQDWHRLQDARRAVCSSQPAQLEKPPGTRSPTALAPPVPTPRSPPGSGGFQQPRSQEKLHVLLNQQHHHGLGRFFHGRLCYGRWVVRCRFSSIGCSLSRLRVRPSRQNLVICLKGCG